MNIFDVPQSLLDLVQIQANDGMEWPAPEEVVRPLAPVPRFHPKLLPKLLRRRVYDVAHRMQCPVDFVAAPLIVALGAIVGSRCAVRPKQRDTWTEYPNVWGAILAPPGQLKTPAVSEALRLLHPLERRAQEEHDAATIQFVGEQFAREMNAKALQKQLTNRANNGLASSFGDPLYQQIAQLKTDGKKPTVKRFRTNDATVEKLAELCTENPQGILVIRDELVGLLASCVKEGREGDRAFYLEGWNGNATFRQDRIGRGSIAVVRLCLSLFGTIQPMRLQTFMYGMDGLQHDGLLQRFQVMVYPDLLSERRLIDQLPDRAAEEAVETAVENLAYMDFEAMGAAPGEGRTAPFYRFDATAQTAFYRWLEELERKIAGEESSLMAEHLSKYRKLVPALALILHLVGIAECGKGKKAIDVHDLGRATRWADHLEAHARRVFGQATDYRLVAARALQRKIGDGKLSNGFSERDVYRAGWSQLDGPEVVHEACAELVAAGWIRPIQERRVTKPGSPRYEINPVLMGGTGADRQN
jgi:hypothetical protein